MIRPIRVVEIPWLAEVHAESMPANERWTEDAFFRLLSLPGVDALVDEGGFVMLRAAADEAELLSLVVLPAARRRGLGRALLRAACRQAAVQGAASMFLEVSETNLAARGLYASEGFVLVGRRRAYYADGTTALVLRAVLSPAS